MKYFMLLHLLLQYMFGVEFEFMKDSHECEKRDLKREMENVKEKLL